MSVQVNTYVLRGAMLGYEQLIERHEALEPYLDDPFEGIHHHDGLCVLIDGMSGEYVAIGHVIAKSRDGAQFDAPVALPPPDAMSAELLKTAIEALVGVPVVIGDFVISHYR